MSMKILTIPQFTLSNQVNHNTGYHRVNKIKMPGIREETERLEADNKKEEERGEALKREEERIKKLIEEEKKKRQGRKGEE